MNLKKKYILLAGFFFAVICTALSFVLITPTSITKIELLNDHLIYTAGDTIELSFKTNQPKEVQLLITTAYGNQIIKGEITSNNILKFILPDFISKQAGVVTFQLLDQEKLLYQNTLRIQYNPELQNVLESYLGPTRITTEVSDFSMLTVIPTDIFDNPITDSTEIRIKKQFEIQETENLMYTEHSLAWQKISTSQKSGKMLIAASTPNSASKEFSLNIYPTHAENFKVFATRKHPYADGNQTLTLYTSVIKDRFDNTVSDGQYVEFLIIDEQGTVTVASGTTINGVAKTFLVHPDEKSIWTCTAQIPSFAVSEALSLSFLPALSDFPVNFKNDTIHVGPIRGYLNQLLPDGSAISLRISTNHKENIKMHKKSVNGKVKFIINPNAYKIANPVTVEIKTMGIQKKFERIFIK
ncbi:hypothetical protein NBT05_07265 [Aquimarina sp. ERC-38]|uniref:hypothetical protein n=1 Tax=Aquimarina sp. ERC-38 TaxID=2949996 RepID=UPI00224781E9|nr:hypothetical protein [Aquimarina sp. ERC-38]UZO82267.1 hypothetical protein NBT05_07265 [Aquimarina sp. ERC-38]